MDEIILETQSHPFVLARRGLRGRHFHSTENTAPDRFLSDFDCFLGAHYDLLPFTILSTLLKSGSKSLIVTVES
jgi:hypothetical protein